MIGWNVRTLRRVSIMQNAKVWVCGLVVGMVLAGTAFLAAPSASEATAKEDLKDHWRNHDGHWSYWNAEDKQWYYTDGTHWFYHDGKAWQPYRFDKKFGREGFERGEYKVPPPEAKIVLPKHEVWRPR
jgi:hypothetical protein